MLGLAAAAYICVLSAVQMSADSQPNFPHLHGIILVRKQKLAQGGDFAASQLTGSQAEAIERSGACTPARIADGGRCISRRDHPTWQQGDVLQRARCSESKLHRQQSEKYLEVLWMR